MLNTKRPVTVTAAILLLASASACRHDRTTSTAPTPYPGERPGVEAPAVSEHEIDSLISRFAEISEEGFGFASTYGGSAFAPIAGTESMGALIFTEHEIGTPDSLKRIVEIGPRALPALLDRLTDDTPTALTVSSSFGLFGSMWFDHEIPGNPANQEEAKILERVLQRRDNHSDREISGREYTLTVGDICFVAIGQIVNRGYNAARYQPSACMVINSPVYDAELAEEVRAIWGSTDARRKLLDSLLIDYATEVGADDFQTGAAMRLLYYFPDRARSMLVDRLRRLDVTSTDFQKRSDHNGVYEPALVKAVAWTTDAAIRAELWSIMQRTTLVEVAAAAADGVGAEHDEEVFSKLTSMLRALPPEEDGPFGNAVELLAAVARRLPGRMKLVCREYLADGGVQRQIAVCEAFRRVECRAALEVLFSMLDEHSETGWMYAVDPEEHEAQLPLRVCDIAAETITAYYPDLAFTLAGTHDDLDRQIEAIKRGLTKP